MKRVGILVGREVTFPESIIKSINEKGNGEVVARIDQTNDHASDQLPFEPLRFRR